VLSFLMCMSWCTAIDNTICLILYCLIDCVIKGYAGRSSSNIILVITNYNKESAKMLQLFIARDTY